MQELNEFRREGLEALEKVVLNDNITSIEGGAFSDTGLTSFDFPKKVTRIDGGTFSNSKIEKIESISKKGKERASKIANENLLNIQKAFGIK